MYQTQRTEFSPKSMQQENGTKDFITVFPITVFFLSCLLGLCYRYCRSRRCCFSKLLIVFSPITWPICLTYLLLTKVIYMPRKKSRSPKSSEKQVEPTNSFFRVFNCLLSFCFHMSPISFSFTKYLSAKEVILRYNEQKIVTADELHEKLKEDKFLDLILNLLNGLNSRFFFKILLSGSLREGFGKPLPSTSILGSDYDLMLIPDGVEVVESSQINAATSGGVVESSQINVATSGRVAPLFEAISDPNQNPETPSGYVWLKLLDPTLKNWKNLCFDRITPNGG